jgi:cytokinesis protein
MLEGLTGGKDGGLNVRRRRESADSERERRRRRRQQASSAKSDEGGMLSPTNETIVEEEEGSDKRASVGSMGEGSQGLNTPVTIVSPPSPEQSRGDRELPTPPPDA